MRKGQFYRHESAQSIYIDVIRVLLIKPGTWLVKCRVLGVYGNPYYETTSFRISHESRSHWEQFFPLA